MTTTSTRRAVLAGAAAIPALALPAIANAESDAELPRLWRRRRALLLGINHAQEQFAVASDAMPAWARPGEEHMNEKGERVGYVVGWPEIENPTPASISGGYRLIRPSPADVKINLQNYVSLFGRRGPGRKAKLASYVECMKRVRARIAAQNTEQEKAGLDVIERRMEGLSEALSEIERDIENLPPSLNMVAAVIVIAGSYGENDFADEVLRPFAASVTEPVATEVRELVEAA
jgi:hypothetical protein